MTTTVLDALRGYVNVSKYSVCNSQNENCHLNTNRDIKVKVKCSRYRPGVAQRVGRGIAVLFHDRGTRRG